MWPAEPRGRPAVLGAVSPLYGPVSAVHPLLGPAGTPDVVVSHVETAQAVPVLGISVDVRAGGAGRTYRQAALCGVGEAVERYSAMQVPYERLGFGTRSALDRYVSPAEAWRLYDEPRHAAPASCGCLSEAVNLADDAPFGWVAAERLHDGRPAYVPAQWVYLGYEPPAEEPSLGWTTSSGLSCAESWDQAVLGALLELIERDAFMRVWRRRLVLPQVRWEGLLQQMPALRQAMSLPGGARVDVVDLSPTTVAPTMLAVARHPHLELAAMAIGAASALTRREAVVKAVTEACHTYQLAAMFRWAERRGVVDALVDDDLDRHVLDYVDHERARRADFLDSGALVADLDEPVPAAAGTGPDDARMLAGLLVAQGVEAFVVDVTAPDVAELGLHVARVVSPQACQLDVGPHAPYLGQARFCTPVHDQGSVTPDELNRDPHPFP